jgi:hypothetical protein
MLPSVRSTLKFPAISSTRVVRWSSAVHSWRLSPGGWIPHLAAKTLKESKKSLVAPVVVTRERGQRSTVWARVLAQRCRFPARLDLPPEAGPELVRIHDYQARELEVSADQVQAKPRAFYPERAGIFGQEPPHGRGQAHRVHRVSGMLLTHCVVYIVPAEQFLFHLPPQRGRDFRITTEIGQRLMESLGDNRQLPRSSPRMLTAGGG